MSRPSQPTAIPIDREALDGAIDDLEQVYEAAHADAEERLIDWGAYAPLSRVIKLLRELAA